MDIYMNPLHLWAPFVVFIFFFAPIFKREIIFTFFIIMKSIFTFLATLALCNAVYNPANGDDWTQLKPKQPLLEGSHDSLSFNFGFVVTPFIVNDEGEYEEPTPLPITRLITTEVYVPIVTSAPQPTKAANVIQIHDGQIQRHAAGQDDDEEFCEELSDDEGDYKRSAEDSDCGENDTEEDSCGTDSDSEFDSLFLPVSCVFEDTLQMRLEDGILRDSNDRIGSIVGSHQIQFDGPVPQYGSIYAAGWSVTKNGLLALGNSTMFYQCASGSFYNLYNKKIADQCYPVTLEVVELIEC